MKTTNQHIKYWKNRKIDWMKEYISGIDEASGQPIWNHPHRQLIIDELKKENFGSVLELGCGPGPNLVRILKDFPNVQVGGIDVSEDAIKLARSIFPINAVFDVASIDDFYFSQDSADIVLTDAALIYMSPLRVGKVLHDIHSVCRKKAVFVEFNSTSPLEQLGIWWSSGYYAHNFRALLEQHDFYDIQIKKIPPETWGFPWSKWGYIITARV